MIVGAKDGERLAAVIGDRSRPLKHIQRARIVVYSADRLSVLEVGPLMSGFDPKRTLRRYQ